MLVSDFPVQSTETVTSFLDSELKKQLNATPVDASDQFKEWQADTSAILDILSDIQRKIKMTISGIMLSMLLLLLPTAFFTITVTLFQSPFAPLLILGTIWIVAGGLLAFMSALQKKVKDRHSLVSDELNFKPVKEKEEYVTYTLRKIIQEADKKKENGKFSDTFTSLRASVATSKYASGVQKKTTRKVVFIRIGINLLPRTYVFRMEDTV